MKINVLLMFGGESSEHEVSLRTAENIYKNLNKENYNVTLLGVTKSGKWSLYENDFLKGAKEHDKIRLNEDSIINGGSGFQVLIDTLESHSIDIVFPALHGSFGEDGQVQGLLEMLKVPYVGNGVTSSALCFDKDFAKSVLERNGVRVVDSITVNNSKVSLYDRENPVNRKSNKILSKVRENVSTKKPSFKSVKNELGVPFYIKPANEGSSVGVSRVTNESDFHKAWEKACERDDKILIEKEIVGKEIECAMIGNGIPYASIPGEVVLDGGFYDYEEKYTEESSASIQIPADIPERVQKEIQETSLKAYKLLGCKGLARIDFFVDNSNIVYVNEINTMPGFTSKSMYPKMWEKSGYSIESILDALIGLGLEPKK